VVATAEATHYFWMRHRLKINIPIPTKRNKETNQLTKSVRSIALKPQMGLKISELQSVQTKPNKIADKT
jgi:hypothetical protein